MIVTIPSLNRWTGNPVYQNIILESKHPENFFFFVRKEQYEHYREYCDKATIIKIEENVHNIGETRKYIDNHMRKLGVKFYAQMDDRVSQLSTVVLRNGKCACISGRNWCKGHIDAMLEDISMIVSAVIHEYNCALLSLRPRSFANGITSDCAVELNGNISQIDDILIINTEYPLENLPETNEYFEDCNYAISAISKGLCVGVIQTFTKSTIESFPSRCFSNKTEKDKRIKNELYPLLCEQYNCGNYTKLTEGKDGHPVLKLIHKNAPVKRIKISQDELEGLIYEYCY